MTSTASLGFNYVPERGDEFLSLFPHRYDYIYAPHPSIGEHPQWQTENRYPLSDRLIQQGKYLYGVRFSAQTKYCLLDIDTTSVYHPNQDAFAVERIVAALEPLGLVSYVACTSSYSQGLHLYFPFQTAQHSWQIAATVSYLLENKGFHCQPGQLEVFPNRKLYVVNDTPKLFNGHRLPLQTGSYLLNANLEPIASSRQAFVQQWYQCQEHNTLDTVLLEQVFKQLHCPKRYVSQRADKFLDDLNAEIEAGWTGKGQTNYLLGRITMRTYIFHHVIHGGLPLSGDDLIAEIVAIATGLPGYHDWCGHQHEIHHRASEWARCIENSRYFPYGSSQGKYKAKQEIKEQNIEKTWNEQRSATAQEKIQKAVAELLEIGQLPPTATARFQKLVKYGIGGSTLYKYKSLWHPSLWKTPQTPQSSNREAGDAMASPASPANPTSLLSAADRNPLPGKEFSPLEGDYSAKGVRNGAELVGWKYWFAVLQGQRDRQKQDQMTQRATYLQSRAQIYAQQQRDKMIMYLRSQDPILMKEALTWALQQEDSSLETLLPEEDWPILSSDRFLSVFSDVCSHLGIVQQTLMLHQDYG